jgi:4a-hydroxytetrahydrobiopterin dehydratase
MSNTLAKKECAPCRGDVAPLGSAVLSGLLLELGNQWQLVSEHHLEKEFAFKGFMPGVDFVNRIAEVAEAQSHHPDLEVGWGRVKVLIWTHKIDGLTESDFVLAAKIDEVL